MSEKEQQNGYNSISDIAVALIRGKIKPNEARKLIAGLKTNPITIIPTENTAEDIGTTEELKAPPTKSRIKGNTPK